MKKIIIFSLFVFGITQAAFASHPHDRVCVATIQSADSSTTSMVFQYSVGRTYESGDPNADSREIAAQASSSGGDYLDLPATLYKSALTKIKSKGSLIIPMTLTAQVDGEKKVLFNGKFDIQNEILNGTFTNASEAKTDAVLKLVCVSQPALNLQQSEVDINDSARAK